MEIQDPAQEIKKLQDQKYISEWEAEQSRPIKPTWTEKIDLGSGIWCYRNVLPKGDGIPKRLEEILESNDNQYDWMPAYVGYQERMPEYRDCVDFKYKKTDIYGDREADNKLRDIWQECYDPQYQAVRDYCRMYNIHNLRYWEAFNFIRYTPGNHFMEHHDHGYSYNCTVSLVGYFNDDYEGGELYFRLQNLNVKPQAGDLYIFPSNFMYPHQAKKVLSGTKYSIVTMLDYSAKFHTPEMFIETGN
jgi:hypothetical protein